jgi:hypothetical protein
MRVGLFRRRAWRSAYRELNRADTDGLLQLDDLERLAIAAYLIGSDDTAGAWERAHDGSLRLRDRTRAARCAFWLAYGSVRRGDAALGAG